MIFFEILMKKRKRNLLTIQQKKQIRLYKKQHPFIIHEDLALMFSDQYNVEISRKQIGDILKNDFLDDTTMDENRKTFKKPYNLLFEETLIKWIRDAEKKINLNNLMIIEKAKQLSTSMNLNLKCSIGWLEKFKERNGLRYYSISGEKNCVNDEEIIKELNRIEEKIKEYGKGNIFNFDETALFFNAKPTKVLTTSYSLRKGFKKDKRKLTVGLMINLSGEEKFKPIVIHKFKKPRCFKYFSPNIYCDFYSSRNAWMTVEIFNIIMKKFDNYFEKKNRKILLMIDNAPVHQLKIKLISIEIFYLKPNLTSVLQPLDSGIIFNFKIIYRSMQIKHYLSMYEQNKSIHINIKDAIKMLSQAWNSITPYKIRNYIDRMLKQPKEKIEICHKEITENLKKFHETFHEEILNSNEFVDIDSKLDLVVFEEESQIDESELTLKEKMNDMNESQCDSSVFEQESIIVPKYELVKNSLEIIKNYLLYSGICDESDMNRMKKIDEKIKKIKKCNEKQTLLTDYFEKK